MGHCFFLLGVERYPYYCQGMRSVFYWQCGRCALPIAFDKEMDGRMQIKGDSYLASTHFVKNLTAMNLNRNHYEPNLLEEEQKR